MVTTPSPGAGKMTVLDDNGFYKVNKTGWERCLRRIVRVLIPPGSPAEIGDVITAPARGEPEVDPRDGSALRGPG